MWCWQACLGAAGDGACTDALARGTCTQAHPAFIALPRSHRGRVPTGHHVTISLSINKRLWHLLFWEKRRSPNRKRPRVQLTSALGLKFFSFLVVLVSPPTDTAKIMARTSEANDDAWRQAEGLPSLADPFMQQYFSGRDALIHQEKKQRSGWLNQRLKDYRQSN
jgi:hypothetical protein